jgi:hypothetical protein
VASIKNTTSGAHGATIEVWTAPASSQFNAGASSITWTANFSGAIDSCCVSIFAFSGLHSLAAPFDPHSGLPATAFNSTSTTPPTVTFSTSLADDTNLFISLRTNGTTATSTPSGYTQIGTDSDAAGVNWASVAIYYKQVSSTQSGATVADASATADVSWTEFVHVLTADATGTAYTLTAAQGSFALTGENVTFSGSHTLAAAVGMFTLTGEAVTFPVSHNLSAATGIFHLNGQKAGFEPIGGPNPSFNFSGSWSLSGEGSPSIRFAVYDPVTQFVLVEFNPNANQNVYGPVPGGAGTTGFLAQLVGSTNPQALLSSVPLITAGGSQILPVP